MRLPARLVAASVALGVPAAWAYPGREDVAGPACGDLPQLDPRFAGLATRLCDPDRLLERALRPGEWRHALFAARAFDNELGLVALGRFGARGVVALVRHTKEPIRDFAAAVAADWGLTRNVTFLVALRGGAQPAAAIVGPLVAIASAAGGAWREAAEREALRLMAQGRPGEAVEASLSAVADAYGASPGLGLPDLGGSVASIDGFTLVNSFKSRFQEGELAWNNCHERRCLELYLDDIRQLSEHFESYYHEAMIIPALNILAARPRRPPRKVLILGGGDGGIASIGLKFDTIERITLLDIDATVSRNSRRYFRDISQAFRDPRFQAKHLDAFAWVKRRGTRARFAGGVFDLIVIDFTDSPHSTFWTRSFYRACNSLLTPGGILVQNVGSMEGPESLRNMYRLIGRAFGSTFSMNGHIPDYATSYQLGLSCKDDIDPRKANFSYWARQNIRTQYYNADMHVELFHPPANVQRVTYTKVASSPDRVFSFRFPATLVEEGIEGDSDWPETEVPEQKVKEYHTRDRTAPKGLKVVAESDGYCSPNRPPGECLSLMLGGRALINDQQIYKDEALTIPALNILGMRAKRVLILGGGTLFAATFVLRYPWVERVVIVEISKHIRDAAKNWFSELKPAVSDPRVEFIIGDVVEVVPSFDEVFDLIVSDLTYMPWEARSRATRIPRTIPYVSRMKDLLAPHGLYIQECGTIGQPRHTARMLDLHRLVFAEGAVQLAQMPQDIGLTEEPPARLMGRYHRPPHFFLMASPTPFDPNAVDWSRWEKVALQPKWYTASLHAAIFVVPLELQRRFSAEPPRRHAVERSAWERFVPLDEERAMAVEADEAKTLAEGQVLAVEMEVSSCSRQNLNSVAGAEELLQEMSRIVGFSGSDGISHESHPQGVAALLLAKESHVAIHTRSADGFASVDLVSSIGLRASTIDELLLLARRRLGCGDGARRVFHRRRAAARA